MASASVTMTITPSNLKNLKLVLSCNPHRKRLQHVLKTLSAVESDPEITVKDDKIVVESRDEDKIQGVDLTGDGTQRVFDKVLLNLARSAPPIPGFLREKGASELVMNSILLTFCMYLVANAGKTTKVPKVFLLQILGKERITNFVIQEIVSSTMTDYSEKENLKLKEKKVTTTQTTEELKKLFLPGKEFGFNAVLELEKSEAEPEAKGSDDDELEIEKSSSSSSDM